MNRLDVSRIILGTSSYDDMKQGNTVSTTGDGGNAWGYYGPAYKKLAPRLFTYTSYAEKNEDLLKLKDYIELRRQIENEYISSYYETRLKDLDIEELLYTLESKFGDKIILLCHEPIDEFCHRRLIADYIELKTGVYIPELKVDSNGIVKKLNPIRYKDRLKKVMNRK